MRFRRLGKSCKVAEVAEELLEEARAGSEITAAAAARRMLGGGSGAPFPKGRSLHPLLGTLPAFLPTSSAGRSGGVPTLSRS